MGLFSSWAMPAVSSPRLHILSRWIDSLSKRRALSPDGWGAAILAASADAPSGRATGRVAAPCRCGGGGGAHGAAAQPIFFRLTSRQNLPKSLAKDTTRQGTDLF